jgi:hypothetical protein
LETSETEQHPFFRLGVKRLLLTAGLMHILLAVIIFVAGHFGLAPSIVDPYGAVMPVSMDTTVNQAKLERTAGLFREFRWDEWEKAEPDAFLRFHSVAFALWGGLTGYNILGWEPLNLALYLTLLYLVFRIAELVFGHRAAALAFVAAALYPTHLIYSLQLQRDPLNIAGVLLFLYAWAQILVHRVRWEDVPRLFTQMFFGGLAIWVTRPDMWELAAAFALVGILLMFVRLAIYKDDRRPLFALAAIGWTVAVFAVIPWWFRGPHRHSDYKVGRTRALSEGSRPSLAIQPPPATRVVRQDGNLIITTVPDQNTNANGSRANANGNIIAVVPDRAFQGQSQPIATPTPRSRTAVEQLVFKVMVMRKAFTYSKIKFGSNIDERVELRTIGDVIGYLPRALLIGAMSPFPDMWFTPGPMAGMWGRAAAGAETFVFYIFEALGLYALWLNRRKLAAWFLALAAIGGFTAIGLVIINVGALYRVRYPYYMLVIILAAGAAASILNSRDRTK